MLVCLCTIQICHNQQDSPYCPARPGAEINAGGIMRLILGLLTLIVLLLSSGCVIREGRGGDRDDHWRGYGHEEHWEHHDHDWR